jgi:hypothetical protein
MNDERPYIGLWWNQLNEIYSRQEGNPEMLQYLVTELAFRRKPKALKLQQEVIAKLNELTAAGFAWPFTDAPNGDGSLHAQWPEVGLLRFVGYTVGENGVSRFQRRKILDAVFQSELPNINSPEYMQEWGLAGTSTRLQKTAVTIAAFVRNAKRRINNMSEAIFEWESDLDYLYQQYYLGRFDFHWPHSD